MMQYLQLFDRQRKRIYRPNMPMPGPWGPRMAAAVLLRLIGRAFSMYCFPDYVY